MSLNLCTFALEISIQVLFMAKELLTPDYIFESSWEVCNKVGGIYTVLSTRAKTLHDVFNDKLFFIGPDFWVGKENPLFIECDNMFVAWKEYALKNDGLKIRIGRWNIPGEPIVFLVWELNLTYCSFN